MILNKFSVPLLELNTSFTFDSAKKYHPTIVVNEKKAKQIDKNIPPNAPNPVANPFCVIIVAFSVISAAEIFALYEPAVKFTITVDKQIKKVEINTPIIAVNLLSRMFGTATA